MVVCTAVLNLSPQEVKAALEESMQLSHKMVREGKFSDACEENEVVVFSVTAAQGSEQELSAAALRCKELEQQVEAQASKISELEQALENSIKSLKSFHSHQQQLYDDFVRLRGKYDEMRSDQLKTLWVQLPKSHEDFQGIPPTDLKLEVTEDAVGEFQLGDVLGEGQFGVVRCVPNGTVVVNNKFPQLSCIVPHNRACTRASQPDRALAIKVIEKAKAHTYLTVSRIAKEISCLQMMSSDLIVRFVQVLHSPTHLYIVTEQAGMDLFEFFSEFESGLPAPLVQQIISYTLQAVQHMHDRGYCHRDLKPENVLLEYDPQAEKVTSLKLCDFGLSAKFGPNKPLTDFCGSPGFFPPELILERHHLGDKVDIWSLGCIALELLIGHNDFCLWWMAAYDYELLQSPEDFKTAIEKSLAAVDNVQCEEAPKAFMKATLKMNPLERASVYQLAAQEWMAGMVPEKRASDMYLEIPSPVGFAVSESFSDSSANSPADTPRHSRGGETPYGAKSILLSDRHRDFIVRRVGENSINLPPIEPQTPQIHRAKRILRDTEFILSRVSQN